VASSIFLLTVGILQFKFHPRPRLIPDIHDTKTSHFKNYTLPDILKPLLFLTRPFVNLPYLKNLKRRTEVLRINVDLSVLVLQKIFLGVTAAALTLILFHSPVFMLIAALVGFFLIDFFILAKIRAKIEAIQKVFPETVDMLDMCINAGADFLSAIRWLIEKSTLNPFIEQLELILNETRIGKTRTEALRDMAERLNLVEVNSFVRTIIQSERMGTSIEESFRALSEDIRDKRFQEGERYAIKASIKILFPLLFCILPAIMIIVAGPIIIKFTQGELIPKGMGF
jgi:pilus assembly protein TadC